MSHGIPKMVSSSASSSKGPDVLGTIGDKSKQPSTFSFPKQSFGKKDPLSRSFQPWFNKWPWIHYDQTNNLAFCSTCVKASKLGNVKICASRRDNAFLSRGFSNCKDLVETKQEDFQFMNNLNNTSILLGYWNRETRCQTLLTCYWQVCKSKRRAYLRKVLQNIIFLGRRGLPCTLHWQALSSKKGGGSERLWIKSIQTSTSCSCWEPVMTKICSRWCNKRAKSTQITPFKTNSPDHRTGSSDKHCSQDPRNRISYPSGWLSY